MPSFASAARNSFRANKKACAAKHRLEGDGARAAAKTKGGYSPVNVLSRYAPNSTSFCLAEYTKKARITPCPDVQIRVRSQIGHGRPRLTCKVGDAFRFASLSALSAITGVDRTFLYHSMELANLAPDIQKTIVDGLVPPGLTLKKLRKGVPNVWADQRKLFGFRPDPL